METFGIKPPIIGLSPMDGVTDAAFRFITNKYGKPDITYTEFVHVMGMCRGSQRLYQDFIFDELERPILGQIFGAEPEYFYHAAKIICELGFDGVDINMGCPAKSVSEKGAGASLIRTPDLATEIIRSVKKGIKDWYETGELTGIDDNIKSHIMIMIDQRRRRAAMREVEFKRYANGEERSLLPVSVKTRIGVSEVTIQDWIKILTAEEPNWIAVHGRTLKQMYQGQANWDAIATGVANTHIPILANGDIKTHADITRVLEHTKAQGVLVGRATYGNPWFFRDINKAKLANGGSEMYLPTLGERLNVMLEHIKLHLQLKGDQAFIQLRKHMGWYVVGYPNAIELRKKLVIANNLDEVENILSVSDIS